LHCRGGHDDGARIDPAAIAQFGSDVLFVLSRMLDVSADQRRDARGLAQHKEHDEYLPRLRH
jgi:hypothetical protein